MVDVHPPILSFAVKTSIVGLDGKLYTPAEAGRWILDDTASQTDQYIDDYMNNEVRVVSKMAQPQNYFYDIVHYPLLGYPDNAYDLNGNNDMYKIFVFLSLLRLRVDLPSPNDLFHFGITRGTELTQIPDENNNLYNYLTLLLEYAVPRLKISTNIGPRSAAGIAWYMAYHKDWISYREVSKLVFPVFDVIDEMPPDMWRVIIGFGSVEDLLTLCKTNRYLSKYCRDQRVWKYFVQQKYNEVYLEFKNLHDTDWKDLYGKCLHEYELAFYRPQPDDPYHYEYKIIFPFYVRDRHIDAPVQIKTAYFPLFSSRYNNRDILYPSENRAINVDKGLEKKLKNRNLNAIYSRRPRAGRQGYSKGYSRICYVYGEEYDVPISPLFDMKTKCERIHRSHVVYFIEPWYKYRQEYRDPDFI